MNYKKMRVLFFIFLIFYSCASSNVKDNSKDVSDSFIVSSSDEGFFVFDLPSSYVFTSRDDFENILPDLTLVIQKKFYPIKESNLYYSFVINIIENSLYDIAFKRDSLFGQMNFSKDGESKKLTIYLYKSLTDKIDSFCSLYKIFFKENRKIEKDKFKKLTFLKSYDFNLKMYNFSKKNSNYVNIASFHLQNIFRIYNSLYVENKIKTVYSYVRTSKSIDIPIFKYSGTSINFDYVILYRYLDINGNVNIKKDFSIEDKKIYLPQSERAGKNLLVFTPVSPFSSDGITNEILKKSIIDIEAVLQKKAITLLHIISIPQRNYSVAFKVVDLDFAGNFNGFVTETSLTNGLSQKGFKLSTLTTGSISNISILLKEAKKVGAKYLIVGAASVADYSSEDLNYSVDIRTYVDIYDCNSGTFIYKLTQTSNARGKNQGIILSLAYTGAGIKLVDSINETLP